jgi:hypothetical protein
LSADGNTAVVGGPLDNGEIGATGVFTRSNGAWAQQAKLVGSGVVGSAGQGVSVAVSGGGNTASVGGPYDNSEAGAAWVFTRSNGAWTQQGGKLIATGPIGRAVRRRQHITGIAGCCARRQRPRRRATKQRD